MKTIYIYLLICFIAILTNAQDANGRWYSAGEIQSKTAVQYGRFEFSMYASNVSGTTSTFFMWKDGSTEANVQWNELDIETFGKSANSWQSNPIWEYETNDANTKRWEGFHNTIPIAKTWVKFTLEWTPNYIAWFNNGTEVRRILKGQNAPSGTDPVGNIADPMRMCFNHWATYPGNWLGAFNAADLPSFQFVDWFTYQKWNGTGFDAVSIRYDFNTIADVTNNYNVSTHTFGENQCTFSTKNVGVVNGMLWLAITGYTASRAPAGDEIPTGPTQPVVYNHILPKKVEAEQFNNQVGLQFETTTDAGGGQNLGYTDAGDYVEYGIEVPSSGNYAIDFRIASMTGNAGFSVAVDGATKINEVPVAATGGWQTWTSLNQTLALVAGKHTLRLTITKAGFNLNWMDIKQSTVTSLQDFDSNASFSVSPQPFTSSTTISLKDGTSIEFVSIYNSIGQLVDVVHGTGEAQMTLGNNLATGLYHLVIRSTTGIQRTKILKQ